MLRAQRSSARQRTSCCRSSSSASGDSVNPVLEKRQSRDHRCPYAETKEQLGGIHIIEARDLNYAVQLISQLPGFKYGLGPVEIRPIADISEMIKESQQRAAKGLTPKATHSSGLFLPSANPKPVDATGTPTPEDRRSTPFASCEGACAVH